MRTLNDIMFPGHFSAIQTAGNAINPIVLPDDCKLQEIILNPHTVIDAETTFDLLKNGTDTTIDATLASASADEVGVSLDLGTSAIHFKKGDAFGMQSNGEQVAATLADVCVIFRR